MLNQFLCFFLLYYKDLFTHTDINAYINGVVKNCFNQFLIIKFYKRKKKNMQNYAQIGVIDHYSLQSIFIISVIA